MIADHVEFSGFDPERVANLLDLAGRGPAGPEALLPGPPGLLVLKRGSRALKLVHTRTGRLGPAGVDLSAGLETLGRARGARWVLAAEEEAVNRATEEASGRLSPGADIVDFGLELGRALLSELEGGGIDLWPPLFDGVRVPARRDLERALDVVIPPRSCVLFYVFSGGTLHAEAICARGDRQIETIAGHGALGIPVPARWRDEHRVLLEAAGRRFGPPALGVFASLDAVRALARGEVEAGELPRLAARKELIVDPSPPWLAAPLGLAALRGAVEVGKRAGERLAKRADPTGLGARLASRVGGALRDRLRGSAVVERVEQRVGSIASAADLSEHLGFDPFVLAGRVAALLREP